MKKAFLLAYGHDFGDREKVKSYLNQIPFIEKWRADLPNAFYLVSAQSAKVIADRLRELSGNKGRFIVSDIPSDSAGWLTPESWHLIQKKEYKPKSA